MLKTLYCKFKIPQYPIDIAQNGIYNCHTFVFLARPKRLSQV